MACVVLCSLQANAALKNFYSQVEVKSTVEGGCVFVSDENITPSVSDYAQNCIKKHTSGTNLFWENSAEHTYYLKALNVGSEVLTFDGWYLNDVLVSKVKNYTAKITATSTNESSPTTAIYVAKFRETAVSIIAPELTGTSFSITPEQNNVGDQVTVTASVHKLNFLGNQNSQPNLTIRFEGWKDEQGNFITDEPEYTFTVTEKNKLIPIIKDFTAKPQNGQ